MASYPKWLYHASKPAVIVPDEAALKALGSEWVEAPVESAKADAHEEAASLQSLVKPSKKVK